MTPAAPAPPRIPWGRNAPLFREFLTTGFKFQRFVADFFLAAGLDNVQMPRQRFRKSISAAKDFVDEADITVGSKVIEVKSRSLNFQTSLNLPSTVLIDTQSGWDSKIRKPFAYIVVSQHTGAMLWTDGTDCSKWAVVRTHDSKRNIDIVCYAARRLQFASLASLIPLLREPPTETP